MIYGIGIARLTSVNGSVWGLEVRYVMIITCEFGGSFYYEKQEQCA